MIVPDVPELVIEVMELDGMWKDPDRSHDLKGVGHRWSSLYGWKKMTHMGIDQNLTSYYVIL